MVRRILQQAIPVVLALTCASVAQTHTFSFGPIPLGGTDDAGVPFTLIDGQPPNQAIGFAGSIQVRGGGQPPYGTAGGEWWGLQAPEGPYNCAGNPVCGWSFPNNGDLIRNTTIPNPGQLIFDNPSCGPRIVGCTSHSTTTVPFCCYGAGVTVTVTTTYIVQKAPCRPPYCDNNDLDDYNNVSTGGTGTATYSPAAKMKMQDEAVEYYAGMYRCGSDRKACLIADGGGPHCPRDLPNCKP